MESYGMCSFLRLPSFGQHHVGDIHPCSLQYSVPLGEYATTNVSSLLLVNICFLLVLVVLFLASFSSFLLFPVMKEATVKSPVSVALEVCTHLCWVRNQEWNYRVTGLMLSRILNTDVPNLDLTTMPCAPRCNGQYQAGDMDLKPQTGVLRRHLMWQGTQREGWGKQAMLGEVWKSGGGLRLWLGFLGRWWCH